jgi:dolichyl-phosphate-mannose-protein mannosyltransferase
VAYALRSRPRWAIAASLGVLLVPATWYVSALWGQFESMYVLPILLGWLLVTRGRPGWAAIAIAVGLMAKPQALPLLVPIAAFYLRRVGLVGSGRAALVAAATVAILWAPFVGAGGIGRYIGNLAEYSSLFAVLSLRAWNPWWILTELAGGGQLVADAVSIFGPVTLRWLGFGLAGLFLTAVFVWVSRRPSATVLAWGLAAASLAAFVGLTAMHERYAYAALVFLLLAWPDRLAIWTWAVLAVTVTLNLVAAVPPSGEPGTLIPVGGALGIAGSVAMTAGLVATMRGLRRAATASDPGTVSEPGITGAAPAG